jgi:hypothetical protein
VQHFEWQRAQAAREGQLTPAGVLRLQAERGGGVHQGAGQAAAAAAGAGQEAGGLKGRAERGAQT